MMISEFDAAKAAEIMRQDIIALLSQNPHSPLAQLIGQALIDLGNE